MKYMFVCTENRANMLNAELLTTLAKLQIKILSMHYIGAKQSHLHHSLSYMQIHIHSNSFC